MSFHRNLRGHDLHAPSQELVENNTGALLPKLKVVALDGMGTAFPQVKVANPAQFFNFGIVNNDIVSGKYGYIVCLGFMFEVNTSPWTVGTVLYSTSTGDLSATPNGAAVATVTKQDSVNGVLYVTAAGGNGGGSDVTAWDVNGNDGLDADANFLGTRDAVPVKFRTNNIQVGQWDVNGRLAVGGHDPARPLHIKSYPAYPDSGLQIDTFAVTSSVDTFVEAYGMTLTNGQVAKVSFHVTCRQANGLERASFTRSALFYREGGNVQVQGVDWQSDFTSKSLPGFEVDYDMGVNTISFKVRNAAVAETFWSGHVEVEILGSST